MVKDKPDFDMDKLSKLVTLARGGDPNAQALLQELLKVEYIQEKTNFPTPINQQKQAYLKLAVSVFKDDPHFGEELAKPFEDLAKWDAVTWRSYKGFNYLGNVDILRKGSDIAGVVVQPPQGQPQPTQPEKRSWFSRKPKEELMG